MTTDARQKNLKICETCKYEFNSLWIPPCSICLIGPNQNWKPIEDDENN